MISFWEKNSFQEYDTIIIGAGISGLSTAASLKEKNPKLKILIVERGTLPTGASTKNAGFACFGSVSELAEDRAALGDSGMVELVTKRWDGLGKTTERLGEKSIGLIKKGGYELISDLLEFDESQMHQINELLNPLFGGNVFFRKDGNLLDFKFGKTEGLIFNRFEAQLDTGELIRSLWLYCCNLGIQIVTGTGVTGIEESENEVEVVTKTINFKSKYVALCTNAFTQSICPTDLGINPGRGMVMLVNPEKPTAISGTFHYDKGYYYFRDYHGKLIFGGGRNIAKEEENTSHFGINERIAKKLNQDLKEIILPDQKYNVEMQWSGIMAFGENKSPIVKKLSNRQYAGVRLGGMGVALGSMVGDELSDLILENYK